MTNKKKLNKQAFAAAASILALSLAAGAAHAEEQEKAFDIEAQPLAKALLEFNEQSGVMVMAPQDLVNGKTAPAIKGEMEPSEALEKILSGSGLKSSESSTGAYTITLASAEVTEPAPQPFRVAQLDQEEDVRGVGREASQVADEERREDVIVVTGTNIRGVYPDSAPLDVYSSDDIALSGATTVERFLETLPQNLNSLSGSAIDIGPGDGTSAVRGSGIDLRGIGAGTTLVLLNGRRLTAPGGESVDVSLIPLEAVERVEVLTDGASAIYGSDAIGGVVNFIVRDDFEGVSINTSYGVATRGGHDNTQADIAAGTSWGSGSGFVSYSYSSQSDLGANERDFSSEALEPQSLLPNARRHGLFASIDQEISPKIKLFGNAFYSSRKSELNSRTAFVDATSNGDQEQLFVSGGLDYEIKDDLFLQIEGTFLDYTEEDLSDNRGLGIQTLKKDEGDSLDLLAKLDGKLFDLPGGESKFSVGGGYSEQTFRTDSVFLGDPFEFTSFDRDSYFAFAEVFAPLIGPEQRVRGFNRLEFSAATRYTEYSDFGSAWTPRFGLLWSPVDGLNLRGTYSRGFRAPTLRELDPNRGSALVFPPTVFGFPDTFSADNSSIFLFWTGLESDLTPEFSDTFTVGFDVSPESIPGLKISGTYFNIDYTDRLGIPGGLLALREPDDFAFAFNATPTITDFTEVLENVPLGSISDPFGLVSDPSDPASFANAVTVIFDGRTRNLAESRSEGVDVSADYSHRTGFGDLNYGVRLSRTITSSQKAFPTSAEVSLLDLVGNPVALRLRGYVGIRRGGLSGQLNVNYIDSYTNTTVTPEEPVDSWTTVDLSIRYEFEGKKLAILDGTSAYLTVNNLLDSDPPFVSAQSANLGLDGLTKSVGFDPVNANPIGQFVTVGLRKTF